jgi:H+/Cl- antiporter ClcA/predicted transcriptional regulator
MSTKGDFTADQRLIIISAIALIIGAICAVVAVVLLKLIGFFTNLFFYQHLSFAFISPAKNHLGVGVILVPAVGGLIIGLMARYGSDRIRGHGIPEALEAILIGRSKMLPKVAVLKPLSSAISIGSGGPFGAEGPIIMTGGALGSIIAQAFHLTAAERKTLLVAGAAGGMSATFATPVAAVLLAVELLLFEWKPRSLVPVALASAVAAAMRPYCLGPGPLFPVPPHPLVDPLGLLACVGVGLVAGLASALLTWGVYAAEDAFHRLPLHWMWWPVLGGVVVGVGGLLQPRALGVGYDIIAGLLQGQFVPAAIAGLMIVKAIIWMVSLGSGTSGGVLAPLLIMGGSLGALEAPYLPGQSRSLWPMISMAAILGGTMRSPLTGVIFALELTLDVQALLPLLIACVTAHAFTVLVLPRSILTEKVARRGYHLTREYTVDPLEALTVEEVMSHDPVTVPTSMSALELERLFFAPLSQHAHQGYPVLDSSGRLVGVVTRSNLIQPSLPEDLSGRTVGQLITQPPVVCFSDETCRTAAERMADTGVGRLPVVAREDPRRVVGVITRSDLLKGRERYLEVEQRRERLLHAPWERPRKPPVGS